MLFLRAVLVIISAISSGAAAGYGAVAPHKMTIAYASIGPRSAPLWAADEFGIFRKYGIEPQVIFVRGAPPVAALTSGDMDIGYTGGTAVLGASVAGIDLKILAVLTNRVTYDVVARPGIKSAEDLRGKRFGVTSIGGTLWMGGVLGLEKLGLDITRDDIRVLVVGPQQGEGPGGRRRPRGGHTGRGARSGPRAGCDPGGEVGAGQRGCAQGDPEHPGDRELGAVARADPPPAVRGENHQPGRGHPPGAGESLRVQERQAGHRE